MSIKKGLSYYTVDTDRYQDRRIKRLKKTFGCKGMAVYDYILCEIYRTNGCYLEWDENTLFDIAEYFALNENVVDEIVKYCGSVGLFEKSLLSRGIITSASIQQRYMDMCFRAKRRIVTIPDICAIDIKKVSAAHEIKDDTIPVSPSNKYAHTMSVSQEVEQLKSEDLWLDQLQVLHNMDKEVLRERLDAFCLQCKADGKEQHSSLQDAKQHFNNWLRKTAVQNNTNSDDKDKRRNQRRGNILSATATETYGDSF